MRISSILLALCISFTAPVVRADSPPPPKKTQPAATKLKLGHYTNTKLGIGLVIDLSTKIDNVAAIPPAKMRYDGESTTWTLKGQHGTQGRIDYVTDKGGVMLQAWDDGRRSIYVLDPDTKRFSEEIDVRRDGDADPL